MTLSFCGAGLAATDDRRRRISKLLGQSAPRHAAPFTNDRGGHVRVRPENHQAEPDRKEAYEKHNVNPKRCAILRDSLIDSGFHPMNDIWITLLCHWASAPRYFRTKPTLILGYMLNSVKYISQKRGGMSMLMLLHHHSPYKNTLNKF